MSEKTLILQNQRHKIFFRQERIKARSQRKESCLNEVKNLSKERVPLKCARPASYLPFRWSLFLRNSLLMTDLSLPSWSAINLIVKFCSRNA